MTLGLAVLQVLAPMPFSFTELTQTLIFLDGNWGNWDLQVTKNGGLTKRVSGSTATIWHSSNDGSNSGLDADLLDGVQGYHI